jgi:hypothetical protein
MGKIRRDRRQEFLFAQKKAPRYPAWGHYLQGVQALTPALIFPDFLKNGIQRFPIGIAVKTHQFHAGH